MKAIEKTEKTITIEMDINELNSIRRAVDYMAIAGRSEKYMALREKIEKIMIGK